MREGRGLRSGASGQQRNRSGDVGGAPGTGSDRPRPRRRVRRLLPRAQRRPACRGRKRCRHAGPAGIRRGAPGRPSRTPWSFPTTSFPDSTRTWLASSSSRSRPTWAWCPRGRASSRVCERSATGRGAADLRRGDHWFQVRLRRGLGGVIGPPGPVVLREGDRRRAPLGCIRGPARCDGAARPVRPGVPGRNAVREPGGHSRGPRRAVSPRSGGLPRPRRAGGKAGHRYARGPRSGGTGPRGRVRCSGSSSATPPSRTTRVLSRPPPPAATPASCTACSTGGWPSRPAPTRSSFRASPTATGRRPSPWRRWLRPGRLRFPCRDPRRPLPGRPEPHGRCPRVWR